MDGNVVSMLDTYYIHILHTLSHPRMHCLYYALQPILTVLLTPNHYPPTLPLLLTPLPYTHTLSPLLTSLTYTQSLPPTLPLLLTTYRLPSYLHLLLTPNHYPPTLPLLLTLTTLTSGRMHAVQQGMALSRSPEANKFMFTIMDELEKVPV